MGAKVRLAAILIVFVTVFCGCTNMNTISDNISPSPSQDSVVVSSETIPSVSIVSPNSVKKQSPDAYVFTEMFRSTMFSLWVPKAYAVTEDIPTDERTAWEMQGLFTWTRQWLVTGSFDENAQMSFTEEEIKSISQDLLGYVYDLDSMYGHVNGASIDFIFGFGPALNCQPIDNSYTETNDIMTIDACITEVKPGEQNVAKWTMRYTFKYMPENSFPYRLLKSELVEGNYPAYYFV